MKIYRIGLLLGASGLKESIVEFECKETANSFTVNTPSGFGGAATRVKKDEILKVDSMIRRDLFDRIHKYTWYFEGQEKQAKHLVYESLLTTASNQAAVANQLLQHISNL